MGKILWKEAAFAGNNSRTTFQSEVERMRDNLSEIHRLLQGNHYSDNEPRRPPAALAAHDVTPPAQKNR